jgi:SAM-dependent methyltransferase
MASLYRNQVEAWLKSQNLMARQTLEIGAGDNPASKIARVATEKIVTLDNDPEMKPTVIHDLNEFCHPDQLFGIYQNPRFDLVLCINVFEYVWQPYNAMANLYNYLEVGGTLIVNFPFVYPLHNPVGIDYLRYTNEWVHKMFHQRFKFAEVEAYILEATEGAPMLDAFYSAEKMHRRKNDRSWLEIGTIVKAVK